MHLAFLIFGTIFWVSFAIMAIFLIFAAKPNGFHSELVEAIIGYSAVIMAIALVIALTTGFIAKDEKRHHQKETSSLVIKAHHVHLRG